MKNTIEYMIRSRLKKASLLVTSATTNRLSQHIVAKLKIQEALLAMTDEEVYRATRPEPKKEEKK